MTLNNNNFCGHNLKLLRKQKNFSQRELGKMLGRDRNFVYRLENGATIPAEILEPLSKCLDLKDPFVLTRKRLETYHVSDLGVKKFR